MRLVDTGTKRYLVEDYAVYYRLGYSIGNSIIEGTFESVTGLSYGVKADREFWRGITDAIGDRKPPRDVKIVHGTMTLYLMGNHA